MDTVSIIRCEDYKFENVKKAVYEALEGIDAIKLKIGKGSKVLVKSNLLMRKSPGSSGGNSEISAGYRLQGNNRG